MSDINCLTSRQLLSIEKKSAFSIVQQETYATYNKCDGSIIMSSKEYNLANPISTILMIFLIIIVLVLMYFDDKRNKR